MAPLSSEAGGVDTYVLATIAGKDHGLQFHSAEIRQGLFTPCEIQLELGFARSESNKVYQTALNSWLGEKLVLRVKDRLKSSIEKVYEGIVTSANVTTDAVQLQALSEDHLLALARRHRSFVNKSVHQIVNQVVTETLPSKHALTSPKKSLQFRFFQQYDETDYDFLKRLAWYDGCVFFHDGEKFHYVPRLSAKGTALDLGLQHLSDVNARCTLEINRWLGVPYDFTKHTEPKSEPQKSGSFTPPSNRFLSDTYKKSQSLYKKAEEEIYNQPVIESPEFDQLMKNQQALTAGRMLRVEGETNHPLVAVGKAIKCDEHPLLKSPLLVTSLHAQFRDTVYSARFEAVADECAVLPAEPDRRQHQALFQPARVTDNKDKDKLGRVQIQYLWDLKGEARPWARILQMGAGKTSAGKSYGTHYIPRVGDHVLVGHENGDPSLPIILGALYHSEKKPDFVTENGTEEVLVVRTPNESTIRVVDKKGDEEVIVSMRDNKNIIRLELKQPKITVESVGGTILVHGKSIEIKADDKLALTSKEVEITAQENMKVSVTKDLTSTVGGTSRETITSKKEITAGADLVEKATGNVDIQGAVSVKVQGAQVESSAAGTNTIKGAMVMIN
jgi:type VI secretion system secreted protein VgrG